MRYDPEALNALRANHGSAIVATSEGPTDPWIEIRGEALPAVARTLLGGADLRFDYLNDLCVVDFCPHDKKVAKLVGEPRLEVVYHLSSLERKRLLTLKVTLPRWSDEEAKTPPKLPSVADVWATAEWHECEAYDLSGVEFVGHPNLRRILCPEDWVGHPLRKDYQMPLEYHGIRGR